MCKSPLFKIAWVVVLIVQGLAQGQTSNQVLAPATATAPSEIWRETNTAPFPCGPAAMAFAFQVLGLPVVDDEFKGLADKNGQSNFETLTNYAVKKGLTVKHVHLSPSDLLSLKNVAILQLEVRKDPNEISPKEVNEMDYHFVTVAGPVDEQTVYVFDPLAKNGWRGPSLLSMLAEKMTGNALILSKYPITFEPGQARMSWGNMWGVFVVTGVILLLLSFIIAFVRRHIRTDPLSRRSGIPAPTSSGTIIVVLILAVQAQIVKGQASTAAGTSSPFVKSSTLHDAGTVSHGTELNHTFELVNVRSQPIEVKLGPVSCSCVGAKLEGPNRLSPGSTTRISVKVHADKPGEGSNGVIVFISGEPDPVRLAVRAVVKDDTRISTSLIDFSRIVRGTKQKSLPFEITHHGAADEPFEIVDISIDQPFLKISERQAANVTKISGDVLRHEFSYSVTLDPQTVPPGPFMGKMTIKAQNGTKPLSFNLGVMGTATETVVTRPQRIFQLANSLPNQLKVSISLQSMDKQDISIDKITSEGIDPPEWSEGPNSKDHTKDLELQFRIPQPSTTIKGSCTIHLKQPQGLQIVLPVDLIVAQQ